MTFINCEGSRTDIFLWAIINQHTESQAYRAAEKLGVVKTKN